MVDMSSVPTSTVTETLISSDPAGGHSSISSSIPTNGVTKKNGTTTTSSSSSHYFNFICRLLRIMVLDLPLLILFTLYVTTVVIEYVHDNYLYQQLRLMFFGR